MPSARVDEDTPRFLAAGEPPTYIGWGSVVCGSAGDMAKLAVGALKIAGKRGVVLGGWAQVGAQDLGARRRLSSARVETIALALYLSLDARRFCFVCLALDARRGTH